MPDRIQLSRRAGFKLPEEAVSVARPSKWGNPFRYRHHTGLARVPAALGDGEWEYEGRISAAGMRHDYHHPRGKITICHIRYMTRAEIVETYRRVLTGDLTPALRSSGITTRSLGHTVEEARRELAGKTLACWCPLPKPGEPDICHGAVLLEVSNERETANA